MQIRIMAYPAQVDPAVTALRRLFDVEYVGDPAPAEKAPGKVRVYVRAHLPKEHR